MSLRIIGGRLKNRPLKTPPEKITRPTTSIVRKAVFDICQPIILDARFLDLFAGSGAMGIEALSRGACFATFIDMSGQAIHCILDNLSHLKLEEVSRVKKGDALPFLRQMQKKKEHFNIVYVDPPYDKERVDEILLFFDTSLLLDQGGLLFIEESMPSSLNWEQHQLNTLVHHDTRRFGKTLLHQFTKTRGSDPAHLYP